MDVESWAEKCISSIISLEDMKEIMNKSIKNAETWGDFYAGIIIGVYKLGKEQAKSEIIRCKNCKYWNIEDGDVDKRCNKLNGYWYPDEYCSCADVREED